MAEMKTVTGIVTVIYSGSANLEVEQLWVGEDPPENPTLKDIVEKMRDYDKPELLYEFGLTKNATIIVTEKCKKY